MPVMVCIAFVVFTPILMAQTNRQKVVHQALYALDPLASGTSSQTINGNYVGDWNWLDSDYTSYYTVMNWYNYYQNGSWTCYPSDFAASGDVCPNLTGHPVDSFYSNPSGYGYSPIIPEVPYGRGGQCTYFANLVVYRSGVDTKPFPSLANMWAQGNANMQDVQPGDVIIRYNTSRVNHVAVVVAVYASGGSVTSVDVVDSDYFPDTESGVQYPEIITRHNFTMTNLQGWFRIWPVPGY